jgi:pimeloyl-ACP methyl ester carboxylesterase
MSAMRGRAGGARTLMLLAAALVLQAPEAPTASTAPAPATASAGCAGTSIDIDGNSIWVRRQGAGDLTVVFESGFGNDSGVWSQIEPSVRALGVRTFVYDRAGLGRSTIETATPYSIDNDVHILRRALQECRLDGPLLLVAHSYGGAMALLLATENPQVAGLVLLDAVVPGVWPPEEVDRNLAVMRAQYAAIREQAPQLAKVAIPFAESMPATAARINALQVPAALPIIDIVAEHGQTQPQSARLWLAAHQAFDAASPHREYLLASGSSHKVMLDRPALVESAITRLVRQLRQPPR